MKIPYINTYILYFRCHGKGILEIKCPERLTSKSLGEMCESADFCLKKGDKGLELKTDHDYFYQIQAQLHVVEASYCDFMVWAPHEHFIQRIMPDSEFFDEALARVEKMIKCCIVPELVGKYYSVPRYDPKQQQNTNNVGMT